MEEDDDVLKNPAPNWRDRVPISAPIMVDPPNAALPTVPTSQVLGPYAADMEKIIVKKSSVRNNKF